MASKKPTDDQLDELFEGIGDNTAAKKPINTKPKAKGNAADILAELENELGDTQPSRPHTPRIREPASKTSPTKKAAAESAAPAADRLPEDKSADTNRSYHASFTPTATSSDLPDPEKQDLVEQTQASQVATGGGWWGGILSTATAAMKQAEVVVKEIQKNEEAKKWADQVRGNVGALRGFSKS
jgi:hypothetical protein